MGLFRKDPGEKPLQTETPDEDALESLSERVNRSSMPPDAREAALREIHRLEKIHPDTTEYTIGVTYIDYLLSMPWNVYTPDNLDLKRAQHVLEDAHYGLSEIKERILEHLAVRTLRTQRPLRILVVEDEELTRKNLAHVLTGEGHFVDTAVHGAHALRILQDESFDLVITDLKMERVDGIEVLKYAKERRPQTDVVLITGYATVDSAVDAMKEGATDYLAKPFQLEELRNVVRKVWEEKTREHRVRGPVLCFVGPPGTGKTSLGRSIAQAMGRHFVRLSFAGLKDEAEIRGHRRTYAGAMPGRIIQELRRIGSMNPVFLMDEVDKVGQDLKETSVSTLLEILDPHQNERFMDHYLDVPVDLSRVMFILTANLTDTLPPALLDRLEILALSGYTDEEKIEIARRHLIPRQVEENALTGFAPSFEAEALLRIVQRYTREAGVRDLERRIASICRKIAREFVRPDGKRCSRTITADSVERYLGPPRFHYEAVESPDGIGVTTGLVWTESGGDIIFVEATLMRGKCTLLLTGSLGEIMRESALAALSYLRSHADRFGIDADRFLDHDVHVHIPAGAIPKDGPSAGLPMAMALISLFTSRPARKQVACTGEITLTGRVLPVAGLREKLLAARRAKVQAVVLPSRNRADLEALPPRIYSDIRIHFIDSLDEAVDLVLTPPPPA